MSGSSLFFDKHGNARPVPTGIIVIAAAFLAAARVKGGFLSYESDKVIAIVVPVAGTIVALALPAAQLAQSVLESFLTNAQELIKSGDPIHGIVKFLTNLANDRRRNLEAMKMVVYFGLASFLIGMVGVLGAFHPEKISDSMAVRDVIACLSSAFLIASVLWFLPVVKSSFNFRKANELIDLLKKTPESAGKSKEDTVLPAPATGAAGQAAAKPAA